MSSAPSRVLRLINADDLLPALKSIIPDAQKRNSPIFLYINSTLKPETQLPWCPDCAAFDPILKAIYSTYNLTVVIASVDRASWKAIPVADAAGTLVSPPPHTFRTLPQLKTSCIPTLYKVGDISSTNAWESLPDPEIQDAAKLSSFLNIDQLSLNNNTVLSVQDLPQHDELFFDHNTSVDIESREDARKVLETFLNINIQNH